MDSVTIELAEGFIAAQSIPKAGCTLEIEVGEYKQTYDYHGRQISSGPRAARWTEGSVTDKHDDEFVVRGRLADFVPRDVVALETTQTCRKGEVPWA